MKNPKQNSVHKQLLHSATVIFEESGYNSARVCDIVAHAGVAQGTFYLYFKNKEDILITLVEDFFTRLLGKTLRQFPANKLNNTQDLIEQTQQMWLTILQNCQNEPTLAKLVLRGSCVLGANSQKKIDKQFDIIAKAICSYLEDISKRNIIQLENTKLTAWVVLGIIERAIHYSVAINPNEDINKLSLQISAIELGALLNHEKLNER